MSFLKESLAEVMNTRNHNYVRTIMMYLLQTTVVWCPQTYVTRQVLSVRI